MLILILFLLIGLGMVYIAQNNLVPVSLQLGPYVFSNIPLFYIIVGSLLVGLILSYLIFLINSIFITFTINRKDKKIKQKKDEIVELTKQIHKLELENEELKKNSLIDLPPDKNAL